MEYLFGILLLAVLTAALTAFFLVLIFMHYKAKLADRIQEEMMPDKEVIEAYIEFAGDHMLLYREENNEFVAQGTSWEELNEKAIERFPDLMFNVPTEDVKKAIRFKA